MESNGHVGYDAELGSSGLPGWARLVGYVVGLLGAVAAAFVIGLASSGCGADDEESACVEPELLATAWVLGVFLLALVAIVVWEFLLRQRFVDRG